jgi:competence protein ComEC
MTKINTNSQMQKLSEYAVRVASEKFGKSLDYTENSLADFEALLQQAYERFSSPGSGEKTSEEAIKKTAGVWGSYLGELMRRKWGGKWIISETDVRLTINGITYFPLQQVYQRIKLGNQFSIKQYIADVASDLRPPSRKSAENGLTRIIPIFWKSGLTAKILTVMTSLVVLGCCFLSLTQIIPNLIGSITTGIIPTLSDTGVHAPTSTTVPTSTITLAPTASFIPSIVPTFTIAPSFTAIPSLTATEIISSPLPPEKPLRVYFVDVGQGDATLILTPHDQTVLIDGGDTDTGIVQYLQSLGVQRIDLMIATHPHADHIGGLVQVLQAMPVTKVVTNGELEATSVYEHFLDAIMAAKADFVIIKRGDVLSLDGIDFLCLNPLDINNPNPDINENSLVFQFTYGQTTFLMMGDSGASTEADLLASNLLSKVNILKVGHHGSTTGTTSAFLNGISPDVAVYFAGINNIYGLPDAQTIAALKAAGATVYGTDQNGTIIISAGLNGYTITPAKGNPIATIVSTPTVQPTLSSTPTRTPTLASTPTLTLTPTISVSGGLEIISVTSPVDKGAYATLIAKTSPNASCDITVTDASGPSNASGLGHKPADSLGMVSWIWKVGTGTTPGTWPIDVTCNGVTRSTTFTVR